MPTEARAPGARCFGLTLLGLVGLFSLRFVGFYNHQALAVVLLLGTGWAIVSRLWLVRKRRLYPLRGFRGRDSRPQLLQAVGRASFWVAASAACLAVFLRSAEITPHLHLQVQTHVDLWNPDNRSVPFSLEPSGPVPARSDRIDRIVARNGDDTLAISHHDVLALSSDAEARPFERPHRPEVVDTGNPGHGLYGDLDLTDHHASGILDGHFHVLADRIRDVRQGFLLRRPLGRTTRKAWNPDAESLFGLLKRHPVFHHLPPRSSRSRVVNQPTVQSSVDQVIRHHRHPSTRRDHARLRTSEAGLLLGREWVGRAPDDAELRALYARRLSAWRCEVIIALGHVGIDLVLQTPDQVVDPGRPDPAPTNQHLAAP